MVELVELPLVSNQQTKDWTLTPQRSTTKILPNSRIIFLSTSSVSKFDWITLTAKLDLQQYDS